MGVGSRYILVNGIPRDQCFQRKTSDVQQQEIHLKMSTDKYAFVEAVIALLEMEAYADAVVGVSGEVWKPSENGQASLLIIYQPSALLFPQFDRLLFLTHGGNTVYFGDIGENSRVIRSPFKQYGASPCGQGETPADWLLKVIGAAPGSKAERNWPETSTGMRATSVLRRAGSSSVWSGGVAISGSATSPDEMSSYSAPFHVQLALCTERVFQPY
ncbi:hypothetical protein CORC01_03999 [Colletotrichum orchidophilum]|uniref:Uncharacterized protein n=1 Tax=Colletotrichum orchidophilum TaxID=1209926 RepID=A0A1G4BGX3_9PEZI|nr:uncharacterized protein CORC01_03999 [Colletotrichum orchidophilum]OHF00682.1 hypothetical protein CORC01_03999 [Colletotrichum orchidophilum]